MIKKLFSICILWVMLYGGGCAREIVHSRGISPGVYVVERDKYGHWIDPYISIQIFTGSQPQIFPWRTISQCTVRMPFVVVCEGLRKVLYRC